VSGLDSATFKEVLSHFPSGVVVVTAQTPEGPAGFTCQTFGSLSLTPLLVTFAAGHDGRSWPRVRAASAVAVNVLGEDQEPLARRFATSGIDKFAGVAWTPGASGAPLLEGALAHLEGAISAIDVHGDHDLVIVEVAHARVGEGAPLVYFRRGYRRLASDGPSVDFES
jgi:3-hydroxy-9,10-secoandrosta-1,3,5(10)-triene-9,17-dione monooxygenase reductase component